MLEDHKRTGAYYNAVLQNRRQFHGKVRRSGEKQRCTASPGGGGRAQERSQHAAAACGGAPRVSRR